MRLRRKKYQQQPEQPLPLSGGWKTVRQSAFLVIALICLLAPTGADAISLRETIHSGLRQTTAGELAETSASLEATEQQSDAVVGAAVGILQAEELRGKTLSQETIEAAATQATEEAVAEAQNAMLAQEQRVLTDSDIDMSSIQSQSSLLHSLQQEEEAAASGTYEGLFDQSLLDQGQTSSADTTLDELKKLRIIDQELAKAQSEQKQDPNAINEQAIEASTLAQMQGQTKTTGQIADLVQRQIQDQVAKIDSAQAIQGSFDALEYAANIETKDFLQEDKEEPKPTPVVAPTPTQAPKPQPAVVDAATAQTQAALEPVSPKLTTVAKTAPKLPDAPLQPSAAASENSMDATFSYKKKVPIKPTVFAQPVKKAPAEERKILDALITKSVELGRKKAGVKKEVKAVVQKSVVVPRLAKDQMADDLFKAKANQVTKEQKPAVRKAATSVANKTEVPKVLVQQTVTKVVKKETPIKQATTQKKVDIVKQEPLPQVKSVEKHEVKEETSNKTAKAVANGKHSKHHKGHKKHHKSYSELVQENVQLDNLFLTMREDLISKPIAHDKKPNSHSLVQLDNRVKTKSKDDDLTVDEQAEATLKSMAHSMNSESKKEQDSFKSPTDVSVVVNKQKAADNVAPSDSAAKKLAEGTEVDSMLEKAETIEPEHQLPVTDTGNEHVPGGKKGDSAIVKLLEEDETERALKKAESHAAKNEQSEAPEPSPAVTLPEKSKTQAHGDSTIKKLLEDQETEDSLADLQTNQSENGDTSSNSPEEDSFLQLGAQVQATMKARVQANAQAAAAAQALAAMGLQQQAQVSAQDQNLIDTLKATINQLEMKKNPALAVAAAKKKAVTNIQKALTKKILTRLDDSQPIVNVFSKMQSLSRMMPAIQDFERRLGILHQVEPILESAIGTLSRVVDLSSPVPAMPKALMAPAPQPAPAPVVINAPAGPDLGQLKSLLAQAEGAQNGGGGGMGMFASQPAPAPAADESSGLEALLGGLGGGGAGGLEALLGGGGEEAAAPAMAAPAFLQQAPAAPAEAAGGDDAALLSRLLGSSLVQVDADLETETKS